MRSSLFIFSRLVLPRGILVTPHISTQQLSALKKGLDINSTTPPSQYQMFKLVTNRKFVRAAKRVMEELNAAGLKMNSDVRIPPSITT